MPRTSNKPRLLRPHDLAYSPVGLWQFNRSLVDSSGGGYNLSLLAGAELYTSMGPGLVGAFSDGTTAFQRVAYDAALAIVGELTVEALIRTASSPTAQCIIASFSSTGELQANNVLWQTSIESGSVIKYDAEYGAGTNATYSCVSARPLIGETYHFAMTRNAAATEVKFYINSVLMETSGALHAPDGGGSSRLLVPIAPIGSAVASLKLVARQLSDAEIYREYSHTMLG